MFLILSTVIDMFDSHFDSDVRLLPISFLIKSVNVAFLSCNLQFLRNSSSVIDRNGGDSNVVLVIFS